MKESGSKKPPIGIRIAGWASILVKLSKLAKLAKFAKLTKPLITVVTMSLSAIAYAFWLGPWFSIGLIGMLFVHEMGHVIALQARGFKASAPIFIPFIGAVIFGPQKMNRRDEAIVGIGGPVLGGAAALLVLVGWFLIEDKRSDTAAILMMVSYVGMFLNAFNMLPIRPLDGGRVSQAIGPWFKYIGLVTLAIFSVFFREPVILYIWILVLPELTFMALVLRAMVSVILWISMATLMAMGFSSQPFWVDIIDCAFGALLATMLVFFALTKVDPSLEDDQRPTLETQERLQWMIYYVALTAALVAVMVYQAQQVVSLR